MLMKCAKSYNTQVLININENVLNPRILRLTGPNLLFMSFVSLHLL